MLNADRNTLDPSILEAGVWPVIPPIEDHEQMAARLRHLEHSVRGAANLQRRLLPDRLPLLEGYRFASLYRPSEVLGGDFYDVSPRSTDTLLVVADIVGHGFQAALTTMLLKDIFQDSAMSRRDPAALLTHMNERLHRVVPQEMFAAAAILRLTPGSSNIRFANAGLPYPFLLRRDEERVEEARVGGMPLGLFPNDELETYQEFTLSLGPGDVLLVGSDGIGSVVADDGELFEDVCLRKVLNRLRGQDGDVVIQTLLREAIAFNRHRPLPDDISVVAITRGERDEPKRTS